MEVKYKIVEELCVLSESPSGWRKEVNRVSWNDKDPVLDIRNWSPNHEKCGKGVTLTAEEYEIFQSFINQ